MIVILEDDDMPLPLHMEYRAHAILRLNGDDFLVEKDYQKPWPNDWMTIIKSLNTQLVAAEVDEIIMADDDD